MTREDDADEDDEDDADDDLWIVYQQKLGRQDNLMEKLNNYSKIDLPFASEDELQQELMRLSEVELDVGAQQQLRELSELRPEIKRLRAGCLEQGIIDDTYNEEKTTTCFRRNR
jgi:hypothetical protein